MIFKEDWEQCKNRFDAFWEGEIIDRCCLAVTSPREKPIDLNIEYIETEDPVEQWTNPEIRVNNFLYECSQTFFGGEAFPGFWPNFGPGVMASFIGSPFVFDKDTVWFDTDPVIEDWSDNHKIEFDDKSKMWKYLIRMMEYSLERSNNKYTFGLTDLGGNLDIIASLRGTQKLLFDLYDNPDVVKELSEKIDKIWIKCYDRLHSITSPFMEGTTAWMPLWCRQRWYPLQCDFSAMISPRMFEEFVKPSFIRATNFLDRSIFHMDGPGQIPLLDNYLDVDNLTGIQWTPGDGNLNECDEKWYPLYKRIQEKGKRLVLLFADANGIEKLLDNISPEGLFIKTHCRSEDEARDLLAKVQKWSLKKPGQDRSGG